MNSVGVNDTAGIGNLPSDMLEFLQTPTEIFADAPTVNLYAAGKSQEFRPTQTIRSEGPFIFNIPRQGTDYTPLHTFRMYVKFKLSKEDKTAFLDEDPFGVCYGLPAMLFESVNLAFNGNSINQGMNTYYPYKVYMESLLSYNNDAYKTGLNSMLMYKDSSNTSSLDKNYGLQKRTKLAVNENGFECEFPLNLDLFQGHRLLPNNVDITLEFHRARDDFLLMKGPKSTFNVKLEIEDIMLSVRRVTLSHPLFEQNEKMFLNDVAKYPFTRNEVSSYDIDPQRSVVNLNNIHNGTLPKKIVFGLVKAKAKNGDKSSNPFEFDNFNVSKAYLRLSGTCLPSTPIPIGFSKKLYGRAYRHFLDNIGIGASDEGCLINYEEYGGGFAFYAFDLTNEMCNSIHRHTAKQGSLDICLEFETAPTETLSCIVYSSFDALLTVDKNRDIRTTF